MICTTQVDVTAAAIRGELIEINETWQDPQPATICGISDAMVRGRVEVRMFGCAHADAYDGALLRLYGNSEATLHSHAQAYLHDYAQAYIA